MVGTPEQKTAILKIKDGIEDDAAFWEWIRTQPGYESNKERIESARKAMNRNLMWKDKAIMLSAAYLSVTYPIPEVRTLGANNNPNFQYWVAVDKHTGIGADIIGRACEGINLIPSRGQFLTFYFAGALCNKVQSMPFFELCKMYKIEAMEFKDFNEAKNKWLQLRPLFN